MSQLKVAISLLSTNDKVPFLITVFKEIQIKIKVKI